METQKHSPKCQTEPRQGTGMCPNLKELDQPWNMDSEKYECDVCGKRITLYYDEMS